MAYQTRQRDPLLDDQTHEMLMRFGQQALGFALLGLGAALAAMLWSYAPDDPHFMAATDAVPQNLLGHVGASVAAILMMIMGYGAVLLPIASVVWGMRFLRSTRHERALGRIAFLPIAVALAAIYAASLTPPENWVHSFGLGGLFGDTVVGALLSALPMAPQVGLKIVAALAFVLCMLMSGSVLGVDRAEFRLGVRYFLLGLVAIGAFVSGWQGRRLSWYLAPHPAQHASLHSSPQRPSAARLPSRRASAWCLRAPVELCFPPEESQQLQRLPRISPPVCLGPHERSHRATAF